MNDLYSEHITCLMGLYENEMAGTSAREGASGGSYGSIVDLAFHTSPIGLVLISSSHPTHEQCMALRGVVARSLLHLQWFFHVPIGDGIAITTWSSEPRKGLTICRCHSNGSIFVLSYFKTPCVDPTGIQICELPL